MNDVFLVLLVITALFVVFLVVKSISKWTFCVLCASVCVTWMGLLLLHWFGEFTEPLIIAILMGQSIVGLYYFLEKRTNEALHIFRLPLLLTLTLAALFSIGTPVSLPSSLGLLATLWIALSLLYLYRENPRTKIVVDRLIACCKDW
ncbi:MAG: hypothetical protein OEQ39_22590 [Gammaproteobacteria bacterium]|nr:hypothetical protein [Gammaproteobacteria bacterium]MDH3468934.1 hypothetical protein [Gammaproteobacteria bacterium]